MGLLYLYILWPNRAASVPLSLSIKGSNSNFVVVLVVVSQELYRKWKEITMNSSSDQSKYRVWDYPIREQV